MFEPTVCCTFLSWTS